MCINIFKRTLVDAAFPVLLPEPEPEFRRPDRPPLPPSPHFPLPDLMEHSGEEAEERYSRQQSNCCNSGEIQV